MYDFDIGNDVQTIEAWVEIYQDDQDIMPYVAPYSNDENLGIYGLESFQNDPELLKEYDFAVVIKCRFRKDK